MFTDFEAKTISFYKKKKNINEEEKDVQTTDFQIECEDKLIQTIILKDKVTQTEFSDIATFSKSLNIDSEKLKKFLDKAYVIVADALESTNDEYPIYDSDEEEERFLSDELVTRFPTIYSDKNLKISDISWNCKGTIFYASSYFEQHSGPCNHNSHFFYFKFHDFSKQINQNEIEKNYIEFNSCIRCLEPHPKNPDLLALATYFGEINIIDMNSPESIKYSSKVDTYFHKECIISLKWIKVDNEYVKVILNKYLLSLSEDGKLLIWDLEDGLKFPSQGYLLKFRMKEVKTPLLINPLIISQNNFELYNFLIGTIEGNIYRCVLTFTNTNKFDHIFSNSTGFVWKNSVKRLLDNCTEDQILDIKKESEKFLKNKDIVEIGPDEFFKTKPDINKIYKNALKSNFEKHISVVRCISFHHFVKNVFLSTSYDGSLRIYHYNQSKFLISHHLDNDFFTTAVFSPFNPNLIISGTSTGKIFFYKIKDKTFKIVHKIERKIDNSMISNTVLGLKFNSLDSNIMSISFENGITEIIRLSSSFASYKYDGINRFAKLINSLMI